MKKILNLRSFCAALLFAGAVMLSSNAAFAQSGQVTAGNSTLEPAFDDMTGNLVFVRQPINAPFPVNSNEHAIAPLYMVVYPVQSTVPADNLNCQPTNCDHLNVLPFPDPDYGLASTSDCQTFNGGAPCSVVKGHNHLLGVPSTGGDFNVNWQVKLVIFTGKAFADGSINSVITLLSQVQTLVGSGDAVIIDTPITFHGAIVSGQAYASGTPTHIAVP